MDGNNSNESNSKKESGDSNNDTDKMDNGLGWEVGTGAKPHIATYQYSD